MSKVTEYAALSLSNVVFMMLINVKMPKIVDILTFMSRINSVHSRVEYNFFLITFRPCLDGLMCHSQDLARFSEVYIWVNMSYSRFLEVVGIIYVCFWTQSVLKIL